MTSGESRPIKGWRTRMKETAEELRRRVWEAPAKTVYHQGIEARNYDDRIDHTPWFHREFGAERAIARAALKKHKLERMRIERSEWTDEKRAAVNATKRAWWAALPAEWKASRIAEINEWKSIALQSDETREKYNATTRAWRASQPAEWHQAENEKTRQRRAKKPDVYRAIDKRSKDRRREQINANRRAAYAANREIYLTRSREQRAASRDRVNELARAAYARKKLKNIG